MTESIEELKARIEQLEKEKEANTSVYCKIAEKGGVSVYGLGQRFPITLYVDGWEKLFANVALVQKFLEENRSKLKEKTTR